MEFTCECSSHSDYKQCFQLWAQKQPDYIGHLWYQDTDDFDGDYGSPWYYYGVQVYLKDVTAEYGS